MDDLGTPSPHEGSICCEKETDRFSICYNPHATGSDCEVNRINAVPRIFGLDIGTTSIGFAVIDYDPDRASGTIVRLGVRIFPEARDPKGVPLNQERRQARLRRRQLRRRRERRRLLGEVLQEAGLLPARNTPGWAAAMKLDPYDLRQRAFEGEPLSPFETGRAIYHLAQRRHFKGRDIDEISDDAGAEERKTDGDEGEAKGTREATLKTLKEDGRTLGAWLAGRGPHERRRGVHASREVVEREFSEIWAPLLPEGTRELVRDAIFRQRPVFWRLNTLGACRFVPDARLCPKGSWLSQQRRMLEKLNNLSLIGGNQRPLDAEERGAILAKLQTQASMTWPGVRKALAPVYQARGELGVEKALKFNLEEGGERKLLGNAVEARLSGIFRGSWQCHPRRQQLRDAVHDLIWQSDYGEVGKQRVVILPALERAARRKEAARRLVAEFGLSDNQAEKITALKLPTGWEPYSVDALRAMLPHLETGVRFGEIVNGPGWEEWRNGTFPSRERPTGEIVDRLPSPANPEENRRIASLRNPTVARSRNELRKVVNNLIPMFGKPDLIRVELARDVGISKRQREERAAGIRRQERRREAARKNLQENGIAEPSRTDLEKWMLWEECGRRCPYTGDTISFDGLFRTGEFEVEHIWPRYRSLDDSFRNKTLCRRNVNREKGNRTPFEYLGHDREAWVAIANRLYGMKASRGGIGMPPGKIKRFLANAIPDDFAARQLNDTGYAAREAVAYLKKLWPDEGQKASVKVFAASGRVTAHLRRLWGLNNVLSDSGEKTRADHRHHAIDALTVACCHAGMTQKLSRYWQAKDTPGIPEPRVPPPWEMVRSDAEKAVTDIVVSHRVRRKISGPLHKETVYGDTGEEDTKKGGPIYRFFVTRKKVEALSAKELNEEILDENIRKIVGAWVEENGGNPKKAFPPYPKRGRKGPEIRKVRLRKRQQLSLMARVSTGYADLGNNHHIAIYGLSSGKVTYEVVSLFEASQRLARREPVVRRECGDGTRFMMSLSIGDALVFSEEGDGEIWIVNKLSANGQVYLCRHTDARNPKKLWAPKATTFAKKGARKLSVDPVGRVRPAND